MGALRLLVALPLLQAELMRARYQRQPRMLTATTDRLPTPTASAPHAWQRWPPEHGFRLEQALFPTGSHLVAAVGALVTLRETLSGAGLDRPLLPRDPERAGRYVGFLP